MTGPSDEESELYHVIYLSSATERLSQGPLLEMLTMGRRKNVARGLTGILLHRDGTYLHFLEGRREDVDVLLLQLRMDRRHGALKVLREGSLGRRLYPDSPLAFKDLSGLTGSQMAERSGELGLILQQQTGQNQQYRGGVNGTAIAHGQQG
jgi:hypothetical protein